MAKQFLSNLDLNSAAKVVNAANGTSPQDYVTLAQVNALVEGLAWKDSARVSTQGNISIASPGATIDGITMVANDRFLARSQTAGAENGIYIWNGAATPATRSLDASTSDELESAVITVDEGTSAGATYRQSVVNFVLGTNTNTWALFGTSAGAASETTAGIAELATQAETDTGTDDLRIVTPLKLATYANKKLKSDTLIGDGSATSYTVTHNFNTRNVMVEVFRDSGSYDTIICDVNRTSVNAVQLVFAVAPSSNQFRVLVLG